MGKFDNQVALITGGSSGIGLATAHLFASEGATVIITGRDAKKLDAALASLPKSARAIQSDIGNSADREQLFAKDLIDFENKIDILIFCSGVIQDASLSQITEAQFDTLMNINTKGVLFSMKHAVANNIFKKNARVVVLTSSITKCVVPAYYSYTASKSALLSIAQLLAQELYAKGIRLNIVCPGATNTPILSGLNCTEAELEVIQKSIGKSLPYGERAEPIDIAQAILFLASEESRFAIGTELVIDGGQFLT